MVSGSFSLPYSGFFSPFPHGTGSLSVSQEYLALPDGPGRFIQGYTCPALLRIPLSYKILPIQGYHLYCSAFQLILVTFIFILWSYNPTFAVTNMVWAVSRSLAATNEIIIIFYSSGYLDVSVLRVRLLADNISSICWVAPFGNLRVSVCATNRSLSQLVTSFFASESLGIPHTPLFSLCVLLITCSITYIKTDKS